MVCILCIVAITLYENIYIYRYIIQYRVGCMVEGTLITVHR